MRGKFVHISFKYLLKFQVPGNSYYALMKLRVQIYQKSSTT